MNHTLTDQAKHLEAALRERVLTHSDDPSRAQVYLALAAQVQSVAERLAEIEPKLEYRMLEEGERIQEGDQVNRIFGGWGSVGMTIGTTLLRAHVGNFRRRVIPAAEFQQLSDFREQL